MKAKGSKWKSKVTRKEEVDKDVEVVINIGLMQYKDVSLKPLIQGYTEKGRWKI